MPYNGVGVFTRVYQWVQDAANGIFVDATRTDTDSNDIAAGLTNCVTRDGQSPWLANIPAGGFKLTGLANGLNPTDSVNYGQVFSSPTFTGTATFANLTAVGNVSFSGGSVAMSSATTVTVPTVATGDSSTNAASTAFVQNTAFSSALPNQTGNAGKFVTTNGTTPSWTDTFTIAVNESKGANIASAATINLTTATGNLVHITGTTTITAITIPSGAERTLVFDGVLTLTHNATTLILPTGANIITAVGDCMIVRGDGAGNARVIEYQRASGFSLLLPGMTLLAPPITPSASANIDALTIFTAAYDNYLIIGEGITNNSAGPDSMNIRFANAGVVDTGSNYRIQSTGFSGGSMSAAGASIGTTVVVQSAGTRGMNFRIEIENANSTTLLKSCGIRAISQSDGTPTFQSAIVHGAYTASNAISGIRFFWQSGANFAATGSIRIYGHNNTQT